MTAIIMAAAFDAFAIALAAVCIMAREALECKRQAATAWELLDEARRRRE